MFTLRSCFRYCEKRRHSRLLASQKEPLLRRGDQAVRPPAEQTKNINGKAIAADIRREVKVLADELKREHGITPGLAVILVGTRKDSATYVRNKKKVATEVNFHTVDVDLPETVSQEALLKEVEKLNRDPAIHAILVGLPLPEHIDEATVLKRIRVEKDADGFTAENVGNLCTRGGDPPLAVPCTPAGCIELLQRSGVEVSGKNAVVIGRSNVVGMPVAQILQSMDATVTICHSRTRDIAAHVRSADIVVAAIGEPNYVKGEWLKPGCVVIDVGINPVEDPTKKLGYRLVGDVDYAAAQGIASWITPVPGGVGPMTIAMQLKNTLNLARHSLGLPRAPLRLHGDQQALAPSGATSQGQAARSAALLAAAGADGAHMLPPGQDFAVVVSCHGGSDIWQAAVDSVDLRNKVQELSARGEAPAVVMQTCAGGHTPVRLVTLAEDTSCREVLCSAQTFPEAVASLGV